MDGLGPRAGAQSMGPSRSERLRPLPHLCRRHAGSAQFLSPCMERALSRVTERGGGSALPETQVGLGERDSCLAGQSRRRYPFTRRESG
jgi:hypothetical protein